METKMETTLLGFRVGREKGNTLYRAYRGYLGIIFSDRLGTTSKA